jgi:hypothetical protein
MLHIFFGNVLIADLGLRIDEILLRVTSPINLGFIFVE